MPSLRSSLCMARSRPRSRSITCASTRRWPAHSLRLHDIAIPQVRSALATAFALVCVQEVPLVVAVIIFTPTPLVGVRVAEPGGSGRPTGGWREACWGEGGCGACGWQRSGYPDACG